MDPYVACGKLLSIIILTPALVEMVHLEQSGKEDVSQTIVLSLTLNSILSRIWTHDAIHNTG